MERIRRALISVSDKQGLEDFARGLTQPDCQQRKNKHRHVEDKPDDKNDPAGDQSHRSPLQKQLKVMDSTAFSLCMDNKMPIIVFDLFKPGNLRRVVVGEEVGTLVS